MDGVCDYLHLRRKCLDPRGLDASLSKSFTSSGEPTSPADRIRAVLASVEAGPTSDGVDVNADTAENCHGHGVFPLFTS
jgi:hypothetical protein